MSKRIVVIALYETAGQVVAEMLRGAGYECDAFWTHEAIPEALKQAANCDLVVCQVAALETEEELLKWALSDGRDVPIVATAGRAPGYLPKFVFERCRFLQEPFERERLLAVVRETLI